MQQAQTGDRIHFDPFAFPSDNLARIILDTPLTRMNVGGVVIDGNGSGVILDGSQLEGADYPVFLDDVEVAFDGGENVIENGEFIRSILVWYVSLYIKSGFFRNAGFSTKWYSNCNYRYGLVVYPYVRVKVDSCSIFM